MPSNLHLVTRDDDQRGTDHPAARRRFLKHLAKRRVNPAEGELLEDGEEESWL